MNKLLRDLWLQVMLQLLRSHFQLYVLLKFSLTIYSLIIKRAIRELNYIAATKIAIEFKSRFWEKAGQCGGKSITDLPIRFILSELWHSYTRAAIVLASYTWADEALTWDSLPDRERIRYALKI